MIWKPLNGSKRLREEVAEPTEQNSQDGQISLVLRFRTII